ncbi:class I SAM-dependent methyltransferase [Ructibacterium gallinarum]|uniref:SAM-dependent methyltransferase n=1 Tax=Ructibacterium gallinarum TaxID=2779355 RepID=A0A9D5M2S2_9FIRM|nr:SAM-dependent methyltransferase [Ructibacterium gallinarum]MBE5039560.1 SAM-dependent methyltransferase [Ructibacterium gallinarum]
MQEAIETIFRDNLLKGIISNPKGNAKYRQIRFRRLDTQYQIEKRTEKQAFHSFCAPSDLPAKVCQLLTSEYRQLDAWSLDYQYTLKISKKGKAGLSKHKNSTALSAEKLQKHNREKQYILKENTIIPPLVDLGVFTHDGKIVRSMYDKFRQINRFTELIRDGIDELQKDRIRILDFGCGKSYLTFILYYYLTELRGIQAEITGLDLKAEVMEKCNRLAKHYGYEHLHFQTGDINGFHCTELPDMVISLHACDTATDYALFNAIQWNCKLIYSVPCCQHELNHQIQKSSLPLLSRYGLLKERFSALSTDAIRAALLEACGYQVQILEFVDMEHSPKNLLIRAVKKNISLEKRFAAFKEAKELMDAFSFRPTFFTLLTDSGCLDQIKGQG